MEFCNSLEAEIFIQLSSPGNAMVVTSVVVISVISAVLRLSVARIISLPVGCAISFLVSNF